jgi:hypothetical protein
VASRRPVRAATTPSGSSVSRGRQPRGRDQDPRKQSGHDLAGPETARIGELLCQLRQPRRPACPVGLGDQAMPGPGREHREQRMVGPGQRGDCGQGRHRVRCERDRPPAAAGELEDGRDVNDLSRRHSVNLSGAQRPLGTVDRERARALLDVDQDEEVVGVPVVRRKPGVGGFGVKADHRDRWHARALLVAVDRRPVGAHPAQARGGSRRPPDRRMCHRLRLPSCLGTEGCPRLAVDDTRSTTGHRDRPVTEHTGSTP